MPTMSSNQGSQFGFRNNEELAKEQVERERQENRARWAREEELRKERDARLRQFLARTGYDKLVESMVQDFAAVQGWDPSQIKIHWIWHERHDKSGMPDLFLTTRQGSRWHQAAPRGLDQLGRKIVEQTSLKVSFWYDYQHATRLTRGGDSHYEERSKLLITWEVRGGEIKSLK